MRNSIWGTPAKSRISWSAVDRGRTPAWGLRGVDGLEALKVINYIYQSAREGRTIQNPDREGK